jgi:hypothetical protein
MPAPKIDFRADVATVAAGTCTTLRWDVEYVTAVFLNDIGVEGHGSQQVCPPQSESYTLRITHPQGEENRQITISVIIPATPTLAGGQPVAANPATATALPTLNLSGVEVAIPTTTITLIPATTANMVETVIPTPLPSPTREFVQVIVPPLPTAGEAAAAVAALPPATSAPLPPPEAVPASPSNQWLTYAIFGIIVFGLTAMLLLAKR